MNASANCVELVAGTPHRDPPCRSSTPIPRAAPARSRHRRQRAACHPSPDAQHDDQAGWETPRRTAPVAAASAASRRVERHAHLHEIRPLQRRRYHAVREADPCVDRSGRRRRPGARRRRALRPACSEPERLERLRLLEQPAASRHRRPGSTAWRPGRTPLPRDRRGRRRSAGTSPVEPQIAVHAPRHLRQFGGRVDIELPREHPVICRRREPPGATDRTAVYDSVRRVRSVAGFTAPCRRACTRRRARCGSAARRIRDRSCSGGELMCTSTTLLMLSKWMSQTCSMMSDRVIGRSLLRIRNSRSAYSFGRRSMPAPAASHDPVRPCPFRDRPREAGPRRGCPRRSSARSRAMTSASANGLTM